MRKIVCVLYFFSINVSLFSMDPMDIDIFNGSSCQNQIEHCLHNTHSLPEAAQEIRSILIFNTGDDPLWQEVLHEENSAEYAINALAERYEVNQFVVAAYLQTKGAKKCIEQKLVHADDSIKYAAQESLQDIFLQPWTDATPSAVQFLCQHAYPYCLQSKYAKHNGTIFYHPEGAVSHWYYSNNKEKCPDTIIYSMVATHDGILHIASGEPNSIIAHLISVKYPSNRARIQIVNETEIVLEKPIQYFKLIAAPSNAQESIICLSKCSESTTFQEYNYSPFIKRNIINHLTKEQI